MLPISFLEKTDNSIIFDIPIGKPNPHQKCTIGEDTRERVLQQAYKSNTCWYYTFNFIRKRIGKEPCEELVKEREIEKICSERRKAHTKHENSLPAIADQLQNEIGIQFLGGIDLENAKLLLKNKKILESLETPEALEGCPSLIPFLEEFLQEGKCKDMHEFLLNKKFVVRNEINLNFIKNFNVNFEDFIENEISSKNGYKKINWNKRDITSKAGILDFFARDVSAQVYGLKKSSWSPLKGIDGLILELNTKGPLFIGGAIGQTAYVDKPYKMNQKIAERDVYAWKPGAKRHTISHSAHAVLLVGAKKIQDKSYIYFVDSKDAGDPKDKSQQKIYMISYTNLTSNICDLHGRMMQDSIVGYAYHGDFKI